MNLRSVLTILICYLILTACGSTNQFTAPQLQSGLTIDGNLSDWNTSETLIESRDDLNFYTTYDDEFLYIFIDVRNAFKDRAIRQSGLIVYLSDDEDLRKELGIGIPPGSFNLLRENPGQYSSFIRENDWMSKPENRETINRFEEEQFNRIMIVERPGGRSDADYGFVTLSQLEVDGMNAAVNRDGRYLSIEMKIPRDGSSLYRFSGDQVWLGFAVETPNFRIQNESNYSASRQSDRYGGRQRAPQRHNIARNMGEFERWYKINLR
jgi:hypothetical protein